MNLVTALTRYTKFEPRHDDRTVSPDHTSRAGTQSYWIGG
jgi:hypothetical protein